MGYLRFKAAVLILVLCSTNAYNSDSDSDTYCDSYQEIQEVDSEPALHLGVDNNNDSAAAENWKLDDVIDKILGFSREPIKKHGMDRINIPDFQETFTKKVGVVNVKGSFTAKDGWLQKLTSISRRGHAKGRLDDTAVRFDSTLGFNELKFGMAYTAKLSGVTVKGNLMAEVDGNALSFSGGIDFTSSPCKFFVESIQIKELKEVRVSVTGLGVLNWLYSKIVTWVISRLKEELRSAVENKMQKILTKEIPKMKCPSSLGDFFQSLASLKREEY